jgi:hypothetical protein
MNVYEVTGSGEEIAPSNSWSTMPDMTQDVTVNDGDIVIVSFSGNLFLLQQHQGMFRAEADGVAISIEAEISHYGVSASTSRLRCSSVVGVYEHSGAQATVTFTVGWRRTNAGSDFRVYDRTMMVKHITGAMAMTSYEDYSALSYAAPGAWATITDMTRNVPVVNGSVVEVVFQGNLIANQYDTGYFRITVDGTPITFNAQWTVDSSDPQYRVRTLIGLYEYSGSPGTVLVEVEWYSNDIASIDEKQMLIYVYGLLERSEDLKAVFVLGDNMDVYEVDAVSTESAPSSWGDMPDMTQDVVMNDGDIAVITFEGNFLIGPTGKGEFRIAADGVAITYNAEASNDSSTSSTSRLHNQVLVGTYTHSGAQATITFKVEWDRGAATFSVYERKLIVQHFK